MSAQTSQPSHDTHEAQFLAPETHPRAGVEDHYLAILQEALTEPGIVNAAYRAFHNYSMGNQMLAALQLRAKGLALTPIASFNAWRDKGRFVKKGQKAISLFMPVSVKRKADKKGTIDAESQEPAGGAFSVYMLRANWFSLEQTEGEEFVPEVVSPSWDAATALAALDITEAPFEGLLGNVLGYAVGRTIAVGTLNPLKHKTRFHEMAHVVLGHTEALAMADSEVLPRDIMEAEAEGVAYILCSLLNLPGQAESRHYIQGWLDGKDLPEKSARRMFTAADKIMKAGQPIGH
jgi:hypothetical protein